TGDFVKKFKAGFEIPLSFFPYNNSLLFNVNDDLKNLNQERTVYNQVGMFKITDKENKARITISSKNNFSLMACNVELDKKTLMGDETLYQFSFFTTTWDLTLQPHEIKTLSLKIRIERR
ncbi:MAG: hypothetical protein WCS04_04280, partial [Sphaerochaetaceae bacterium]